MVKDLAAHGTIILAMRNAVTSSAVRITHGYRREESPRECDNPRDVILAFMRGAGGETRRGPGGRRRCSPPTGARWYDDRWRSKPGLAQRPVSSAHIVSRGGERARASVSLSLSLSFSPFLSPLLSPSFYLSLFHPFSHFRLYTTNVINVFSL